MEEPYFKVIQLQDSCIDHRCEFPYTDNLPGFPYLFVLRTKKTYSLEPCLIFDYHRGFDPVLPISVGEDLKLSRISDNCQIYRGQFTKDGEWMCKIDQIPTGGIHYQLVYTEYGKEIVIQNGSMDSILVRQKNIDLRTLRKQTVFPRCIGTIDEWPSFLKKQISLGYNSFHFSPIQQTGSSKSYYSIFDQLELANDIFRGSSEEKYEQLEKVLRIFKDERIIFFVDIVLNHTSFDSQWIKKNPQAVFTLENTYMLRSAYELDAALRKWGDNIKDSFADSLMVMDEDQFNQLQGELIKLVQSLNLQEFFMIKSDIRSKFLSAVNISPPSENIFAKDPSQIVLQFIEQHAKGLGCQRFGVTIPDLEQKWKQQNPAYEENDLDLGIEKYNKKWLKKFQQEWIPEIISNIMNQIKYGYLDTNNRSYDDPYPFINPYFSFIQTQKGKIPALNNGWVMGGDPSENMVTNKYFYYLRRKVNVWGDLIRIRYGNSPKDSPAWEHMLKYVKIMAHHFDGFRLDNLHGTPLIVAEYLVREARLVNPEIIIFGQLFTNSESEKALFTRRIGIDSTLEELVNKLSGQQFIQLFHDVMGVSGQYTGSLSPYFTHQDKTIRYLKRQKPIHLIYDLTHDNRTYEQKNRTVLKTPICLLLELTGAFIGSTKGFDQFYTKKIDVTQTRALYLEDQIMPVQAQQKLQKRTIFYKSSNKDEQIGIKGSWDSWNKQIKLHKGNKLHSVVLELPKGSYEYKFVINSKDWICDKKKQVNENGNHAINFGDSIETKIYRDLEELRKKTANYRKKFVSYREYYAYHDENIVFLLRQNKKHEDSIFVIANLSKHKSQINHEIQLPGILTASDVWIQDDFDIYQGLNTAVSIRNHQNIWEYFDVYHNIELHKDILIGNEIPPGFSCIIECKKSDYSIQCIRSMKQLKNSPIRLPPLGALDYNLIMYGVDQQQADTFHISNYVIPNQNRKLIFGGFGGIIRELKLAKRYNNLSLPLFSNLREGNWLLDYYVDRISRYKTLKEVKDIIERTFGCLKLIPHYLKPKYFTTFIYKFCLALQQSVLPEGCDFKKKLHLVSNQFLRNFSTENPLFNVTLSAGLPFFTTGCFRSWGRDTFISNQLLLLHPNIYKDIILQFATVMRYGTIPNLLDFGRRPRYNCRDACWWFIRSIGQYVKKTKDYSILKMKVNMAFLSNDIQEHKQRLERGQKKIMTLEEIVHHIFQSHADGISYRQWHAGYEIDENMKTDGFNIKLTVDDQTGFIVGGNSYNCLTWMDKMGSSAKAGNKGYPATPRAGAPIEMTALLYASLKVMNQLNEEGHYGYNTLSFKKREIKYSEWAKTILKNFQSKYYIPKNCLIKQAKFQEIYRDVVDAPSTLFYEELRLRPNVCIAMAVAPDLFNKQHALNYLRKAQQYLLFSKSIGIATLASAHETLYSPYYDNSDDSSQIQTAHGFSYHNGPEWVWVYGFYVAAKCIFSEGLLKNQYLGLIQPHAKYIEEDEWGSLPQLTDHNGFYNKFSCNSQAWSISSMLLALEYIEKYGK